MSGSARKTGDAQTAQVVTLLNQLGERIVRSEHERLAVREEIESTREILTSLESRAEQTERIFLTMQDNISKKESIAEQLIERQNKLERLYQDSAERLKRAEALTGQIEEAIALQNRLARRLEKTAQDKIRILSKIERIEAAVEETRMTLNSGALVGISVPQPPANDPVKPVADAGKPWWARPLKTQAAVLSSLLIAGLLGGAAISQLVTHWPYAAAIEKIELAGTADSTVSAYETKPAEAPGIAAESVSTEQSVLAPYGEDSLLEAMDSDPDAVAATLNEIEPSVGTMPVETAIDPAQAESPTPQPVSLTTNTEPPKAPVAIAEAVTADAGADIDAFVKAQSNQDRPLSERIAADAALPEAIKKIEAKAFEGVPEAQHDLAAIYTAGHGGVTVDYKRAAQWFSEAAVNGVANARYNLGVLYHQGLGVDRDINKAIGWYRAAAKIGHPEADYNLGIAAIEGIGTEYNPRQAATYFEKAARGGVMEAAYNLGLIHENGLLGDADMNEAVFWYSTASNHNPEARVALDQLVKTLHLKGGDVERITQEYGAIYKLSEPSAIRKSDAGTKKPAVTEMAAVATLTPEDQMSPNDPAVLAKVIPPLSPDESAHLLNSVRKDQAMIAQIQEQLMRLGLYPGPADGLGGPQTEDAIRTYQSKNALPATGKPSEDLLVRMLANELNAASGSAVQ